MDGNIQPVLEKIKSNGVQPDYFEICTGQTNLDTLTEDEIWNILMLCAKECEEEIIDKLLEVHLLNKCLNRQDKNGECALIVACKFGYLVMVEKLFSIKSLDVSLCDNEGNTPLIHASQAGHIEIVEYLVKNVEEMNVDHLNTSGFTALMKASIQGQIDCVRVLIIHGADHSICDPARGMCSQGWAQYCNRHDTAEEIASFNRMSNQDNRYTGMNFQLKNKKSPCEIQSDNQNCMPIRPCKIFNIIRRTLSENICGCTSMRNNQNLPESYTKKLHPEEDSSLFTNIVPRNHHNCHYEKGMVHPGCLNRTFRRSGSMIRPFNQTKRNSTLIIPRVEITKSASVSNQHDSFD